MTEELRDCGDCGAKPGELHKMGCDVERCCLCGRQAIGCSCVYDVNGFDLLTLEETHPDIWNNGPTDWMSAKLAAEEAKYGGRLAWTGSYPNENACRAMNLFCYWGDYTTGEPIDANVMPGKWVRCAKDHPNARPDLNTLAQVARWDKKERRWVDTRP